MTSQLIGPLYTNVTYLGVCVVSTISSYDISSVDCLLYTNVTYLGVCVLSVLYPRMTPPQWIGPLYTNASDLGGSLFLNFYFICRVSYEQSDDQARFEVILTFDSTPSNVRKSATSSSLDVIFTSQDLSAGFGTEVLFG